MMKNEFIKGGKIGLLMLLAAAVLVVAASASFAVTDQTWLKTAAGGQVAGAGNCRFIAVAKGDDSNIITEDDWAGSNYNDANGGYVTAVTGFARTDSTHWPTGWISGASDTYAIWASSIADGQTGTATGTIGASSPNYTTPGTQASQLSLGAANYMAEPGNIKVYAGNGSVLLKWDTVSGATQYRVFRGPVTGTSSCIYSKRGTSTSLCYEDTSLTNGTSYYYIVVPMNGSGWYGVHTNQLAITPDATGVPSITPPLNPTNGNVGASITITGSGFGNPQGTGIVLFNGVQATTITSWNDTQIVAQVPAGATSGNVYVVNSSNKVSSGVAFTVTVPGVPDIASCSPARYAGDASVTMNVVGTSTNFINSTTTATMNPATGVTVNSVTVSDATHAVINVSIVAGTTAGSRDITLITNTESATGEGLFVITAPSFASVMPTSGYQGDTITVVTIEGTGTHFTGTPTVSFGSNITVSSVVVSSATRLTCNIVIGGSAAAGARNVSVTTGGETVTGTGVFTVNTPSFTSVTPNSGAQGSTHTGVAIVGTGTHFTGTPTVNFGSNITVSNVAVSDATHLTCNIAISTEATLGARDVVVTTGGETVTGTNAFTVTVPSTGGQLIYEKAGGIMMAYPNPFNPDDKANPLKMLFNTATGEAVDIYIFDTNARIIWQRRSADPLTADRTVTWDGETSYGEVVENGLYLIRVVKNGKLVAKGKILVIKK